MVVHAAFRLSLNRIGGTPRSNILTILKNLYEVHSNELFTKTLAAAVAVLGLAAGASTATFTVDAWDILGTGNVANLTAAEAKLADPVDAIYAASNINFGTGNINNGSGWAISDA
jgi:hypothetical protein